MSINKIIELIENHVWEDEEVGTVAALLFNQSDISNKTFETFWQELSETNKEELIGRMGDVMEKE